jgi:DNA-binding NarL/FixJ family response regulator
MGDFDREKASFAEAIQFCEGISYRPELALTRLDLAQLLLEHYPDERAEAQRQLDLAIPEFEAMKMPAYLEQALRLRGRRRAAPEPKEPAYPDGLSEREVDVLRLIASGRSNPQIALELVISVNTVQNHVSSILAKAGLANRAEAAAYAQRRGLGSE